MKHLVFVNATGPMVQYDSEEKILIIEDLNPQIKLTWRMSRDEILDMCDKLVKAVRQ